MVSESSSNDNYDKIKSGININYAIAPDKLRVSGGTSAPETGNEKRIPLRLKLIGAGVIAVLAAGAAIGVNALNGAKAPVKAPTETSASVDPTEKPTPSPTVEVRPETSIEQLIKTHEIKANQAPEALAKNIIAEYSNWETAGSDTIVKNLNDQIRKTADGSDGAISKFLDDFTVEQAKIFAPALYGEGYTTDPVATKSIESSIFVNKQTLLNVFATQKDQTPYKRSIEFTSLESHSANNLVVNFVEKDNAGEGNGVKNGVNGTSSRFSYNYAVQGDVIAIKSETVLH